MNIWKPEDVKIIPPLNPEDDTSGLLIPFRDTAGPVGGPIFLPNGEASRVYVHSFRTVYTVAAASPGYDGSWIFDEEAYNAPPTYPPENPWIPAQTGVSLEQPATNYFYSGDFEGMVGEDGDKFPVLRWLVNAPELFPMIPYETRVLPLREMRRWYPNDPRFVSGPGRLKIRQWNMGDVETLPDGRQYARWNQPGGAGRTYPVTLGFTVFEYYSLSLYQLQCPIHFGSAEALFPALLPTALVFSLALSGGVFAPAMPPTWRRRKEHE